MENTTYTNFIDKIAKDFNIESKKKVKRYYKNFPIINGKRKINSFNTSIIVDKDGNEFPYMLNGMRNDEKLLEFDYIYFYKGKTLKEIIDETGVEIKTEPCKICEGGGWYSNGTRYIYKNEYCEI